MNNMPRHLEHKFHRVVGELNALMRELQRTVPDAGYYLANDVLHVMSGPSHEGDVAKRDRSMAHASLARSGGGDW